MQWCTWKTKLLGTFLEGLFRAPSNRISHCIHIVRTSYSQLHARSRIFYLLVEVVYWPCGLKFVYTTINFAFLGIIVKVKLSAKFFLHSFEWFCLQISSDTKYLVVIVYYFQIRNKKEHYIIISRVISSHLGPMYIETPYIYTLNIYLRWFETQISVLIP